MSAVLTPLAAPPAVLSRSDRAPASRTLVDILDRTVVRHPGAAALDDGTRVLSYRDLAAATGAVAARLGDAGIVPGDRVGVRIPSGGNELYVAILGVLRAGAAYVPVEADDPPARAELVFAEAGVAAVLGPDGALDLRPGGPAGRPSVTGRSVTATVTVLPSHPGGGRSGTGSLAGADRIGGAGSATVAGTVPRSDRRRPAGTRPTPADDAWIIFTSGSTGTPKGVAVSHRAAAALVDAEARLFLADAPLGPGDRVLAGLSVAFDASCEEMWLAWRHGACLVPAPRSVVRSGIDLAPWLCERGITVVSTVPTLAALWPVAALDAVRLLILGGEACPPGLAHRLAQPGREVWNTYGPTETTVVACAAPLTAGEPVRIGLPLDGWDLAVVDEHGRPVDAGGEGELVIGGVGLARYLDDARDAQSYAPLPALGWDRAYRSGDRVRHEPEGLVFIGRVDDQVKIGGRRVELGELDVALAALPGVTAAAAGVRAAPDGSPLVVGWLVPRPGDTLDPTALAARLREVLPAGLAPRLAVVDDLPTRTSGKIDRDALPWPVPGPSDRGGGVPGSGSTPTGADDRAGVRLTGTVAWVAEQWITVLGGGPVGPDDDFFAAGGSSLAAARLVVALRQRFPGATVATVYEHTTPAALAAHLDGTRAPTPVIGADREALPSGNRPVARPPGRGLALLAASVPVQTVAALRWLAVVAGIDLLLGIGPVAAGATPGSIVALVVALLLLWTPPGRIALTAATVRLLLLGIRPGTYRRGGAVHVRIVVAERMAEALGATNLSAASWMPLLARLLGATVGPDVVLHALPPLTGFATLGRGCSIEPEVDLGGYAVDGGVVHLGPVTVGARARVGHRCTLAPGSRVGKRAHVLAGSTVTGSVPAGETWGGAPAGPVAAPPGERAWPTTAPPPGRRWAAAYALGAPLIGGLPLVAAAVGVAVLWRLAGPTSSGGSHPGDAGPALTALATALPLATLAALAALAATTAALVRLLGLGVRQGHHPVRSRTGWQVWATLRLLDEARTWLFPLYASMLTPSWLRLLGARVGRHVEASTVLLLPRMTTVGDGAFLADDTMIGAYELAGGWLRVGRAKVGKRAFVGNSGIVGPGRRVRKRSLVAVLSAAPAGAKAGTSWLGSPPTPLRRTPAAADEGRTYRPARRLVAARAAVEALRLVPVVISAALGLAVLAALQGLLLVGGWPLALALSGFVLLAAGAAAAAVTTAAKWILVGRTRPGEHPLWSSFVWRNELVGTFVEVLAAPWFARPALATPAFNVWLRSLGAYVGRGVWCETYWLPEADLVHLGAGVTVNRGCVLQTHLFHDRVMSLDRVTLSAGASLGPHSVALPGSAVGVGTVVGAGSLVLRGDRLPVRSRWTGNPVAPDPAVAPAL